MIIIIEKAAFFPFGVFGCSAGVKKREKYITMLMVQFSSHRWIGPITIKSFIWAFFVLN